MVRVDLERKIETLREELEYNRKVHNEEMEDLKEQIASQECIKPKTGNETGSCCLIYKKGNKCRS